MESADSPLPVPGFRSAGLACGIKKNGQPDLMVIASDGPAAMAGVFTRNVVRAAPVELTREVAAHGACQAVIANSGNANACTGEQGMADAREAAERCAEALGIPADTVAVASTGVIGQNLPMDAVRDGIPKAVAALSADGWAAAAEAIRTTDTVAKMHSVRAAVGGVPVTVTGIAKGSGMIHPDMATMLGFLSTDARVPPPVLKGVLARAVERTFNRITVDGDTSTNDCVLILANGRCGGPEITPDSAEEADFYVMVEAVCGALARAIVADGEGATRLVTVTVAGANSEAEALAMARQIATSNLVKTALFGVDPNWGRILAAAGQAGIPFDPGAVRLRFDDVVLVDRGIYQGLEREKAAGKVMEQRAYAITLEVGAGSAEVSVWTCDLSYDYVRINADYRS